LVTTDNAFIDARLNYETKPLSLLITLISGAGFICYSSVISYLPFSFGT